MGALNFDFLQPSGTPGGQVNSVAGLASTIINFVLLIAGILAIVYLIYSGILYITAAGNPDQAKKGQQGVINAVIGIVIIIAAYFIIGLAMNIGQGLSGGSIG